jgi:hypothetical protein
VFRYGLNNALVLGTVLLMKTSGSPKGPDVESRLFRIFESYDCLFRSEPDRVKKKARRSSHTLGRQFRSYDSNDGGLAFRNSSKEAMDSGDGTVLSLRPRSASARFLLLIVVAITGP